MNIDATCPNWRARVVLMAGFQEFPTPVTAIVCSNSVGAYTARSGSGVGVDIGVGSGASSEHADASAITETRTKIAADFSCTSGTLLGQSEL